MIKTNKIKPLFLILLFSSVILSACTQPAESPTTIADKYWQFIQAGNTVEAEKLITINSRRAYADNNHRTTAIEGFSNNGAITIVNTTITTINPHTSTKQTRTFDTYLVLQQGQWKVDANQTQMPPAASAAEEELQQLAKDLSESMQDNIESIDEAMGQGMKLLNDALRDGSKEMGDSLLELMNELNSSMNDSIDKMKQRREEELQKQNNNPNAKKDEGVI